MQGNEIEKLKNELKIACWCFYHVHRGTAEHLNSLTRIYEIADELKENGVEQEELISICDKAMK